jgi:hypothetical protein
MIDKFSLRVYTDFIVRNYFVSISHPHKGECRKNSAVWLYKKVLTMKWAYTEPAMEIYIFSEQDQVRASAVVDKPKTVVEDPLADAKGITEGFFWS